MLSKNKIKSGNGKITRCGITIPHNKYGMRYDLFFNIKFFDDIETVEYFV